MPLNERDMRHLLAVLKDVAQSAKNGDISTERAVARVSSAMAVEVLSQLADLALISSRAVSLDTGRFVGYVLSAVERAGIAIEDSPARVRLSIEIGEIFYIQGSWDEALARFEQAAALAGQCDYAEGQARALRQSGRLYRRRGDWESAGAALEKALSLYQTLKHAEGEAEVLLNLSNIQFELGNYEQAETLLKRALAVCDEVKSDLLTGDINLSLGVIRHVMGQDEDAVTCFTESLRHFEALGDQRRVGQACHNLGMACAAKREWDRAGVMYERVLDMARQSEDWALTGLIYLCRGEMQADLSDIATAMSYAQNALEIFERLKDPLGQADAYKLLGRIAGLKTAWDLAEELLNESERLQRQHGSRLGQAEVDEIRGRVYERQRDYQRAMEAYQRSAAMYQDLHAMGGVRRIQDAMARLKEISGTN